MTGLRSQVFLRTPWISKAAFEAEGGEASLGEDQFKTLTCQDTTWRSPAHDQFAKSPLAWMALLENISSPEHLHTMWLSRVAVPTTMVQRTVDGKYVGGLCLLTTGFGMIVWRLQVTKHGGQRFYIFYLEKDDTTWRHLAINNLDDWTAAELDVVSPCEHSDLRAKLNLEAGLGLYITRGASAPLTVVADRHGFPGMTDPVLSKLMTLLGMQFPRGDPRPTTLEGIVEALCRHTLGQDADVEACWAAGGATRQVDTVLCKENLDAIQDLLDKEDAEAAGQVAEEQEVERAKRRLKAAAANQKKAGRPKAAGKCAASSSSGPAPPAKEKRPLVARVGSDGWAQAQLMEMAPPVGQLQLTMEDKWHTRWRCRYPCLPPNNTSKVFWDMRSERASQLHCLRFLWACHERATGDSDGPWDFEASGHEV